MRRGFGFLVLGTCTLFTLTQCDNPVVGGSNEGPRDAGDAANTGDDGYTPPFADAAAEAEAAATCEFTCSSDLREVRDCNQNLVRVCTDDLGCDPKTGSCVAGCDSARANMGSVGCDFYAIAPGADCFAAYIANVWSTPITIGVDYQGVSVDTSSFVRVASGDGPSMTYAPLPDGQLPPGEVAIVFLGGKNARYCPPGVTPLAENPWGPDAAFHVTTNAPAAVYDIYPFGGGDSQVTSAALLYPTSAWGDNYVSVDPYNYGDVRTSSFSLELVAREDETDVTIVPTQDVPDDPTFAVAGVLQNEATTWTLQKGKTLRLGSSTGNGLSGSVIRSTKPIGVWSMSGAFDVDYTDCCADSAHQPIPPVKALGSEYVAVRYRNRYDDIEEETPWRILGVVSGTKLTYEPSAPEGAPTTINAGEILKFATSDAFVVHSQDDEHPIYVSAHMTGCTKYATNPSTDCRGDAEFVNVVPSKQFLSSYVFFTDATYSETDIVVVRSKSNDGFQDVELDCAGPLTDWQDVGTSGNYQYTRIDLVRNNFEPQGGCDNGRHEIHSKAPFGITVWGWGSGATGTGPSGFNTTAVSYAYPGGQSVRSVNPVVVLPVPK